MIGFREGKCIFFLKIKKCFIIYIAFIFLFERKWLVEYFLNILVGFVELYMWLELERFVFYVWVYFDLLGYFRKVIIIVKMELRFF